jgi:DNA polymerase-1
MTHAYIDGDIILYRAISFCEDEFDGEPAYDLQQGIRMFDDFLERWLKAVPEVESYTLVFTKGKVFRKEFFPEYKAQRNYSNTWPGIWKLKEYLLDLIDVEVEPNLEADDVIVIRVMENPGSVGISADKDFQTAPIRFFVPASHGKEKGTWFNSSEPEANLYWFRQAIAGDTVDNYKGIPGKGPVKAAGILPEPAPVGVLWEKTKQAFLDAGMTEQDALTMVRLARILRAGDYNWETKEIKLWEPSKATT